MKSLRIWTIVTLIFSILCLSLVAVCLFRPAEFGQWMVDTYTDITSEFDHTVEDAFNKLSLISIISFSVLFITNQILHFCYSAKAKKEGSSEEKPVTNAEKEESVVFKRVKREKEKKTKKERKEKVKKFGKKVVKVAVETVTETKIEAPNQEPIGTNQRLASFLDSFR